MKAEDERHGSIAGYAAHYKDSEKPCAPCQQSKNNYEDNRVRQNAYGRWHIWTDAEPVRQHVRSLMAEGMGFRSVAKAAGKSYATTNYLLYGRDGKQPPTKVRIENAAAILAVRAAPVRSANIGTSRRLRALQAIGYTQTDLAKRLGTYQTLIWRWGTYAQGLVSKQTADAVAALYDELCMTPGPSARTKTGALRRGWAPPLAWDDETIDDPAAEPQGIPGRRDREHIDPNSVDPMNVDRILAGDWRLKCTRAEKEAVAARWIARGDTLHELGKLTGWNADRYAKNPEQGSRHAGLRWSA